MTPKRCDPLRNAIVPFLGVRSDNAIQNEICRPQSLRAIDAKRPQQIKVGDAQAVVPTNSVQVDSEHMTDIERVPQRREHAGPTVCELHGVLQSHHGESSPHPRFAHEL
jgi:hypothetical protein